MQCPNTHCPQDAKEHSKDMGHVFGEWYCFRAGARGSALLVLIVDLVCRY